MEDLQAGQVWTLYHPGSESWSLIIYALEQVSTLNLRTTHIFVSTKPIDGSYRFNKREVGQLYEAGHLVFAADSIIEFHQKSPNALADEYERYYNSYKNELDKFKPMKLPKFRYVKNVDTPQLGAFIIRSYSSIAAPKQMGTAETESEALHVCKFFQRKHCLRRLQAFDYEDDSFKDTSNN